MTMGQGPVHRKASVPLWLFIVFIVVSVYCCFSMYIEGELAHC